MPLLVDTIGNRRLKKEVQFYLILFGLGQRLEYAAETFENRESFVFSQTGERLTFKTLKQKVK